MALGYYSTDYLRSVYHRVFSVKYSDFCILVILVSLEPSLTPVTIKKQTFPQWSHCQNKYLFEKKKLLDTPTFRHDCLSVHQITGQKTELPGGYYQKCTSAERNQHPPELALLVRLCTSVPLGTGIYAHALCACCISSLNIYPPQNQRSLPHFSLFFFHKFSSVLPRIIKVICKS